MLIKEDIRRKVVHMLDESAEVFIGADEIWILWGRNKVVGFLKNELSYTLDEFSDRVLKPMVAALKEAEKC